VATILCADTAPVLVPAAIQFSKDTAQHIASQSNLVAGGAALLSVACSLCAPVSGAVSGFSWVVSGVANEAVVNDDFYQWMNHELYSFSSYEHTALSIAEDTTHYVAVSSSAILPAVIGTNVTARSSAFLENLTARFTRSNPLAEWFSGSKSNSNAANR
jgi:hypothetical protein